MKLNDKELAHFAETANGRSDKEGILWIKENDGKLKKKGGLFTKSTRSVPLFLAHECASVSSVSFQSTTGAGSSLLETSCSISSPKFQ